MCNAAKHAWVTALSQHFFRFAKVVLPSLPALIGTPPRLLACKLANRHAGLAGAARARGARAAGRGGGGFEIGLMIGVQAQGCVRRCCENGATPGPAGMQSVALAATKWVTERLPEFPNGSFCRYCYFQNSPNSNRIAESSLRAVD